MSEILVLGSGSFAARIAFDLAAAGESPIRVTIAGRNIDRLDWLRTAANARAVVFERPIAFESAAIDLIDPEATAAMISMLRPQLVVQAASSQTSQVIAKQDNGWSRLVAEGGLSATAVAQAVLTTRVGRAIAETGSNAALINCCFPDVVNGMVAAAGFPVMCGTGNVAILSNAFAGAERGRGEGRIRVLAHYQTLGAWRQPRDERGGTPPRVWLDETELDDVFRRYGDIKLSVEPAIEVSGASGVPLMLAFVERRSWRGHAPGPGGRPGGYPVALLDGQLMLDLPASLSVTDALAWNAGFEERNGLVVRPGGAVRYTGRLQERLQALSPALAQGFQIGDLEAVYQEMQALRRSLEGA